MKNEKKSECCDRDGHLPQPPLICVRGGSMTGFSAASRIYLRGWRAAAKSLIAGRIGIPNRPAQQRLSHPSSVSQEENPLWPEMNDPDLLSWNCSSP
jgi:hypothetical protein